MEHRGENTALRRGYSYFEQEDFESAVVAYTEAIRLEPDHPEARSNLGMAYQAYADAYQASRARRVKDYAAVFLPLEALRDKRTSEDHLSVSFSGTGSCDTYFSQQVEIYRAVKIMRKWFIVPTTISKILTRNEFLDVFGDLLETEVIEGEEFWVVRKAKEPEIRARIKNLELDNSYRASYAHSYLPESH